MNRERLGPQLLHLKPPCLGEAEGCPRGRPPSCRGVPGQGIPRRAPESPRKVGASPGAQPSSHPRPPLPDNPSRLWGFRALPLSCKAVSSDHLGVGHDLEGPPGKGRSARPQTAEAGSCLVWLWRKGGSRSGDIAMPKVEGGVGPLPRRPPASRRGRSLCPVALITGARHSGLCSLRGGPTRPLTP